ncbi:MAG TPA: DUF433 domain-containing protein [Spirochaetota bacterium]|nr:DUF433 domain-containing protein [Spirochaetota bacterium]
MDRISIDPEICNGKPHIKNTRIMVKNILGMLAGGYDINRILIEYPELSLEDISSALNYAAVILNEEKIIFKEAV